VDEDEGQFLVGLEVLTATPGSGLLRRMGVPQHVPHSQRWITP
jgi:hypothetical protein